MTEKNTPIERLGRAITKAGYVWTEEMIMSYKEAMESLLSPLNGDQVLQLWRQSNGHAMRFAALIESWHGLLPKMFGGSGDIDV